MDVEQNIASGSISASNQQSKYQLALSRGYAHQKEHQLQKALSEGKKLKPPSAFWHISLITLAIVGDILDAVETLAIAPTGGSSEAAGFIIDTIINVFLAIHAFFNNKKLSAAKELQNTFRETARGIQQYRASQNLIQGQSGGQRSLPGEVSSGSGGKAGKAMMAYQAFTLVHSAISDPWGTLKVLLFMAIDYIPVAEILPMRTYMMYTMYRDEKKAYNELKEEMEIVKQLAA